MSNHHLTECLRLTHDDHPVMKERCVAIKLISTFFALKIYKHCNLPFFCIASAPWSGTAQSEVASTNSLSDFPFF
jgi:hypothetical protein